MEGHGMDLDLGEEGWFTKASIYGRKRTGYQLMSVY